MGSDLSVSHVPSASAWLDVPTLVTGHTGFKGSWLCHVLVSLGARVHGFSLDVPTELSHFKSANTQLLLAGDHRGDVAHLEILRDVVQSVRPKVVFHLAAQSQVLEAERNPHSTYKSNVIGTANLLRLASEVSAISAVIVASTDKVYRDFGLKKPFRESDPLGSKGVYAASKVASEHMVMGLAGSMASFPGLATVRAGNVIGGGDWATHRLVPDLVRASQAGTTLTLRYPKATRPWQHVLEPLSGYIILAENLMKDKISFSGAWNFGPSDGALLNVEQLVFACSRILDERLSIVTAPSPIDEQVFLQIDSSKAQERLSWRTVWTLQETIERTVSWYRSNGRSEDMRELTTRQIGEFFARATKDF